MLRTLHLVVKHDTVLICLSSYSEPKAVGGARGVSGKAGGVTIIPFLDLGGTTLRKLVELYT